MHPQAFLQTMWQAKLRSQIFVAMTFDRRYTRRFENVIAPAISGVRMGQLVLEPLRVDISKTGDPILTEIIDATVGYPRVPIAIDSRSSRASRKTATRG